MPKHEPMTAKAIGKKIKSKGLQKLKYFCQMCQKQCRDANGFKCHMTSEAHQRQLLLVAENPGRYLGGFSDEFLKDFLYLLKTRFGTRRVLANQVYQEYIKNREHVHMNATRWVTLTGLCKWMGRKGIATVEENEKGWFITYIDRDPETLKKQENLAKKDKMEKDYEERMAKIIEEQVERGKLGENPKEEVKDEKQELKRDEETKITFSMPMKKINPVAVTAKPLETFSFKMKVESAKAPSSSKSFETNNKPSVKKELENNKRSALDEIMEEEERRKAKKHRRDHWLEPGILVKIVASKLGDKYYQKNCVVREVKDKYTGVVEMVETGDVLKLDQEYLETIIPPVGKTVKVLNGPYVGNEASLLKVNFDKFQCSVKLLTGSGKGRVLEQINYEDISKLA